MYKSTDFSEFFAQATEAMDNTRLGNKWVGATGTHSEKYKKKITKKK